MKPVWKTPEFWATVIGNVLGIIVLTGGLTAEQSNQLGQALQSIVGGVLSVVSLFGFIRAQASRKAAAVALMIARIKRTPDDAAIYSQAILSLDAESRDLLTQL